MNFNSLPEEQQHPELIRRLQQMYQMLPEDRESLLRIQARLSEAAFCSDKRQKPDNGHQPTSRDVPIDCNSHTPGAWDALK